MAGRSPQIGGVEIAGMFYEAYHLHLIEKPGAGLYQSTHVLLQSRVRLWTKKQCKYRYISRAIDQVMPESHDSHVIVSCD